MTPTYLFGAFRLDPARRQLWRGDEELALQRKVFDCILYLVEHQERAVGRDELIAAVWGDIHLTDNALGRAIALARRALDDTGETQRYIKTVQGIGYLWVAPVEVEAAEASGGVDETERRRYRWPWIVPAGLFVGVLAVATIVLWQESDVGSSDGATDRPGRGEVALLLPVTVTAGEPHGWIRLGVMELIAERLRAAGQPMVPSDTVIALLRDRLGEPGPDELSGLASTTGARLVLAAQARLSGTRWTVSLHSLHGARPPLTAVGQAHDVLDAARAAADRMALAIGLTPTAEPAAEPGLATLLQQIEAARLAQQMDVARRLIEEAEPRLRQHPQTRFQWGRIEYYSRHLDAARAVFERLVDETPAERDPLLRARALNGLAVLHMAREEYGAAERKLHEAALLVGAEKTFYLLGTIQNNLGILAEKRNDFEAARVHLARARSIFEGTGDVWRLARLDGDVGVLEIRRERYAEALYHLESAAERLAAVGDAGEELRARAHAIGAHLSRLDSAAALALEPRVNELLAGVASPELAMHARIERAYLQDALGRAQVADELAGEAPRDAAADGVSPALRMAALLLRAERAAANKTGPVHVATLAAKVVDGLAGHADQQDLRARAWLLLVRARLALGRPTAAAEAAAALAAWAEHSETWAPKIDAALAAAEVAAATDRGEDARIAYERAVALAEAGQVPLHLLRVAQSYVPWLLAQGLPGTPDGERALVLAELLAAYTGRSYDVALLQLRVYHALGPLPAWRAALAQARTLAGKRRIPRELQAVPRLDGPVMEGFSTDHG